jgi:hypothetical protein
MLTIGMISVSLLPTADPIILIEPQLWREILKKRELP